MNLIIASYHILFLSIFLFSNKVCGNDRVDSLISIKSFIKVDSLSGSDCYYSLIDSPSLPFIRAHYVPDQKTVKLGYRFSEQITIATYLCWQWRIIIPPINSFEGVKGKDDSGAAVYLVFKPGAQTHVIKYVFSSNLTKGKSIKDHPFAPLYKMFIVVANTVTDENIGKWQNATVDFNSDYKKLYNSKVCPPLLGIGIMSDGDQTKSLVIADYTNFFISRGK